MKTRKGYDVIKSADKRINNTVLNTAGKLDEAFIKFKLKDRMDERGLNQRELEAITGISVPTISNYMNGKHGAISFVHVLSLMSALRLTKITDLIEVELTPEDAAAFIEDSEKWKETKHVPESVMAIMRENFTIGLEK